MSTPTPRPAHEEPRGHGEHGTAPMRPGAVIWAWAALWSIGVVFIPSAFLAAAVTASWVNGIVVLTTVVLVVFSCGFITTRGHGMVWLAAPPLLALMLAFGGLVPSLYLKEEGRDVRGELVRAWSSGEGNGRTRHCVVGWDDAGRRREVDVDGCPKRYEDVVGPEHMPVRFVLSPGVLKSRLGRRRDISPTWDEATAGSALVLLAGLTAWGVAGSVRRERVRASRG